MNKMQAMVNRISITYILIGSFLFITTIPLVTTSVATYYKSKEIINSNTAQYIIQTLKQTNGEIELKLEQFNNDASFLIDPTVQELLNLQVERPLSFQEKKALTNRVAAYNVASPKMTSVSVHSLSGQFIAGLSPESTPNSAPIAEELMQAARELEARVHWRYAGKDRFGNSGVLGIRLINNMLGPEVTPLAFLSFEVPETLIYRSIEKLSLGQTGQAVLVDAGGTILSSQNREWVGRPLDEVNRKRVFGLSEGSYTGEFAGKEYFIAFHTSEMTGWKTLSLVPIREMTPGLQEVYRSNLFYQLLWIALGIALSLVITRTVAAPIKKLIRAMRGVENGDFDMQTDLSGNKEIMILSGSFNKMTSRLKELIRRVYEEELKEKSAQLRALQAQINPHFLYNTLDTVYWMLYMRGQEKIGDVVVAMSSMLRYSISKHGPIVTLEDELNNLFNYVHIQSTRYEDRIAFEYDIDDSLYECKMLKLSLQPAVENAITHGLEPVDRPGTIRIRAYREEDELRIAIADDGVGIPGAKLEEYKARRQIDHGLGIQNVDERIRLTFGEPYGITIESEEGKGTTVLYRLPLQHSK